MKKENENFKEEEIEEYVSGENKHKEDLELSQKKDIGWKQKLGVVFLGIFAASTLFLWAVQFKRSLFVIPQGLPSRNLSKQTDTAISSSKNNLNNIDTDGDGLLDYEEFNYYNTSPYLEDSDSDGVDDKKEIELGQDPNCPQGQNCFRSEEAEAPAESSTSNLKESLLNLGQSQGTEPETGELDRKQMEDVLKGEVEADQLRALLEQFGMNKDLLDQISDEELMKVYKETLKGRDR